MNKEHNSANLLAPGIDDIPHNYIYCYATDETCPQATRCLHAIAARLLQESGRETPLTIQSVNPNYVRQSASSCTLFRDSAPARFARGMTKLFEDIPLKQAQAVRRKVVACFSCESYFYLSRKGERLITPDEQKGIEKAFLSAGIETAPQYDGYVEGVVW